MRRFSTAAAASAACSLVLTAAASALLPAAASDHGVVRHGTERPAHPIAAARSAAAPQTLAAVTAALQALVNPGALLADPPSTVPTFSVPSQGQEEHGRFVAQATSGGAPVDKLWTDDGGFLAWVDGGPGVPISLDVDTFGQSNGSHTLYAADCDASRQCNPESASVDYTVDNGELRVSRPADGATVVGSSVVIGAGSQGGVLEFFVDGTFRRAVTQPPYQVTLSNLAEGRHSLQVVRCALTDTDVCGDRTGVSHFTLVNSAAVTFRPGPSRFSPNGDGRHDTITLGYQLDTAEKVQLTVRRTGGGIVRGPLALGVQAAGAHQFVFNGKSNAGTYLPSSGYTAVLNTSRTVDGGTSTGRAERSVIVDVTAPRLSGLRSSLSTLYPVHDGYKDATTISVTDREPGPATVQIRNDAGTLVRTLPLSTRPGVRHASWLGRDNRGRLVRAGRYAYRVAARDLVGNERLTRTQYLTVSDKHLVRHTGSQTLLPYPSVTGTAIGSCSAVYTPARPDWPKSLSYLSNYDLCYDPSDQAVLAFTQHTVTLPAAARYGTIEVDTFGARTVPGFADKGYVLYETKDGDVSDTGVELGPLPRWHDGPAAAATPLMQGRRFSWWAGTSYWYFYDIQQFTVTYSYFLLQ